MEEKHCYNCWFKAHNQPRWCQIISNPENAPDDAEACRHHRPDAIAKLDEVIELLEKLVAEVRR